MLLLPVRSLLAAQEAQFSREKTAPGAWPQRWRRWAVRLLRSDPCQLAAVPGTIRSKQSQMFGPDKRAQPSDF